MTQLEERLIGLEKNIQDCFDCMKMMLILVLEVASRTGFKPSQEVQDLIARLDNV